MIVTAAMLVGVLWAAEGDAPPADNPPGLWADYSLIAQRNIFSRNRGRRAERTVRNEAEEAPQPTVLAPESYMVLKGIVAAGRTFAAFIEDTRTSEVFRLAVGGMIASGEVTHLTLDSIVYKQEEKESTILVGQTLAGGSGQVVLTFENIMQWSTTPSAATPGSSAGTTAPASEDEAAILKKLLERRKQELGG